MTSRDEDDRFPNHSDSSAVKEQTKDAQNQTDTGKKWKWRAWHEREVPVDIEGRAPDSGVQIEIVSSELTTELAALR